MTDLIKLTNISKLQKEKLVELFCTEQYELKSTLEQQGLINQTAEEFNLTQSQIKRQLKAYLSHHPSGLLLEKQKNQRITPTQIVNLRNYFVESNSHHLSPDGIRDLITFLRQSTYFQNLSRDAIKRQFNTYKSEIMLRCNIGRQFFKITNEMITDNYVKDITIFILYCTYNYFDRNCLYPSQPEVWAQFLKRCSVAYIEGIQSNRNPIEIIKESDQKKVISFIEFFKQLLSCYANCWIQFAQLIKDSTTGHIKRVKPTAKLAELELDLLITRQHLKDNSEIYLFFTEQTYYFEAVINVDPNSLFPKATVS